MLSCRGRYAWARTNKVEQVDLLLGELEITPEYVRDRRDSVAGFVSSGFGRFGGFRSKYGWRRGHRRDRGQLGDTSAKTGGQKSAEKGRDSKDGVLVGWWKAEDNPIRKYNGK